MPFNNAYREVRSKIVRKMVLQCMRGGSTAGIRLDTRDVPPEYIVHANRISNLRRAEVASLTSNVTLDDIFVTAYGHRLVLSVPTKDRESTAIIVSR